MPPPTQATKQAKRTWKSSHWFAREFSGIIRSIYWDRKTLEEGGGWFLVFKNFFSSNLVGRIFFPFFPINFLLHLCCMQFFSSDKRLQEFFFSKSPTPLPPRVKWSAPYEIRPKIWMTETGTSACSISPIRQPWIFSATKATMFSHGKAKDSLYYCRQQLLGHNALICWLRPWRLEVRNFMTFRS